MEFSRQLHPLLASMPQLRKITDLTQPASWWVHTHTHTPPSHPHTFTTLTHSQLDRLVHTQLPHYSHTHTHARTQRQNFTPSHPHTLTPSPGSLQPEACIASSPSTLVPPTLARLTPPWNTSFRPTTPFTAPLYGCWRMRCTSGQTTRLALT